MSGPVEAEGSAELLRRHVPPERRAQLDGVEDLEALLREHLTAARKAWRAGSSSPASGCSSSCARSWPVA